MKSRRFANAPPRDPSLRSFAKNGESRSSRRSPGWPSWWKLLEAILSLCPAKPLQPRKLRRHSLMSLWPPGAEPEIASGWTDLAAVRQGRVFCINDELLNTPATNLLDGLHALAWALHPELFPRPAGI